MNEIVIAVRQFLLVCGAVITIGGAWKVYKDFKKPNDERGNLTLKAELAIINNQLADSGQDKLAEIRDEIQEFLLDKN